MSERPTWTGGESTARVVRDWLTAWDGRGMGNWVPDDPPMLDLLARIEKERDSLIDLLGTLADALTEISESWAGFVDERIGLIADVALEKWEKGPQ